MSTVRRGRKAAGWKKSSAVGYGEVRRRRRRRRRQRRL
jgi:hypothetical protein